MFGIVAVQVVPSIADVLNSAPEASASPSASPGSVPSDSPSPTPSEVSPTPVSPTPQPSGSYSYLIPSESPTAEPALTDEQDIVLRVPTKFLVDPRATSVKASPINVYAEGDILMCISTSGSHLWLSNQSETVQVKGNNSKFLVLSGSPSDINILLNTGQGLRIGGTPRVQGAVLFTRAAVVTKPTLNAELCGQAPKAVSSAISPLGLGMETVKNPVKIS